MRRRDFLSTIAGATAWPFAVRAQQSAMPVIGTIAEVPLVEPLTDAFRQGMAELGYVQGKNFAVEYRLKPESLPQAAADLVRLNVNVIFAAAPAALAAVSKATTSIPVVGIDLESDPVAKGYVKSLARPGGNITGMFLDIPELCGKQMGLLKEIIPRLSRIAIFGVPGLNTSQFKAAEAAALPLISLFGQFPKNGGLVGYGPNLPEMFRRCGEYVGKILHGAVPSDLPIQRPEKFDLVINLKTATALGVNIPTQLQQLADDVIE